MPRVLFVDDDPDILMAFKRSLRKENYEVLTAGSPAQAMEILAHTQVDVIVSDQHMPDMTGERLLDFVRVNCPSTVRIMLTGGADLEAHMRLIGEGELYRFLCKPVATQDLARTVRNALERGRIAEETDRLHRRDPPGSLRGEAAAQGRPSEPGQKREA